MDTMTIAQFVEMVSTKNENNGYVTFGVGFTKANGEYRIMSARRGVSKGVKNDSGVNGSWNRKSNDAANNVLTVYDMNKVDENTQSGNDATKGAFRRIPLNRIDYVKVKGAEYQYDQDTELLIRVQ